jgi:hypothetical protein
MKPLVFFILLSFSQMVIFPSEIDIAAFLENYFESSEFSYERRHIDGQELLFAYRNKNSSEIFDKAIIFRNNEHNFFQPVLYITSNKIINNLGELLFEGIILTQNFYGWSIRIVERNNSFALNFYTNNGVNVTDGPTMIWDTTKNSFKRFQVDRSQW